MEVTAFHGSLHLDDDKLKPPDSRCPLCNSANRQYVYTLQKNPEVLLLQCKDCHAVSASRMPTDEALEEYYSYYYDSSVSKAPDEQITLDNPQRLAKKLADTYYRYQNNQAVSILDCGGGDGTISHLVALHLVKCGAVQVNITIVDYSKKLVSSQDSRITLNKVNTLEDVDKAQYGLVLASAVVEHSPRPSALLRDLLQCMDKSGLFYARTPYVLPIMRLLKLIGVKVDFTYPGHIHDLGQAFWESYFKNEQSDDFKILESRPSIVETTLSKHFLRTVVAHVIKAPWYLLGKSYKYVGGWEIFVLKSSNNENNI